MLEKKDQIPLGLPEKAKSKETLPAIEVANEVIWVNPNFPEIPFNLEKGKETNLGLFLTPTSPEKKIDLEVDQLHRRSALLARVIFKDKQGNFYRDIDLKGVGHIEFFDDSKASVEEIAFRGLKGSYGILDYEKALKVIKTTEEISQLGIRSERYISLIALKEIIDKNGNKISIDEARKREMIDEETTPVLAIRAFGAKNRIEEAFQINKVEDARKLVSQELGFEDKEFTLNDYLNWFAQTLGENLGKLHKNNWVHRGLSSHNITLDCRLVDFDAAEKFDFSSLDKTKENKIKNDWEAAKKALKRLQELIGVQKFSLLEEKFNQAYVKTLGYQPIVI
jgi:tRNA A-37 threonylcarbamoyl transferase component Bud32